MQNKKRSIKPTILLYLVVLACFIAGWVLLYTKFHGQYIYYKQQYRAQDNYTPLLEKAYWYDSMLNMIQYVSLLLLILFFSIWLVASKRFSKKEALFIDIIPITVLVAIYLTLDLLLGTNVEFHANLIFINQILFCVYFLVTLPITIVYSITADEPDEDKRNKTKS